MIAFGWVCVALFCFVRVVSFCCMLSCVTLFWLALCGVACVVLRCVVSFPFFFVLYSI